MAGMTKGTAMAGIHRLHKIQTDASLWIRQHWPAVILSGLILAWRLCQARDLALPAWVDSVHHTLLVRILLEQGTIPGTWEPYLPQVPFYYHFGFHLMPAAFARLTGTTGINLGRAVLIAGQIWHVVLVLGIYALGRVLWPSRERALIAMMLVGFVLQMPAYYTAWGRYTLLAGVAMMAMAMAAALARRPVILAMLITVTAMTHYYALCLLVLFLIILAVTAAEGRRLILLGGAAGLLLASPWLWWVSAHTQRFVRVRAGPTDIRYRPDYIWHLLGPYRNYLLLTLALVGVVIVIARLRREAYSGRDRWLWLIGWTLAIIVSMGPWHLGPFRPDHAAIVLFFPAALLATEALWQLRRPLAIWGGVLALVLWGLWDTKDIVTSETVLATADDVAALQWIENNTPPDAIFLIDVSPWSGLWRGVDGGWWITPLTGRATVLPPAAYGWGDPAMVHQINARAGQVYALREIRKPAYCWELARLMRETGARFYYTRSGRPDWCPTVEPVYRGRAGIAIYELVATMRSRGPALPLRRMI